MVKSLLLTLREKKNKVFNFLLSSVFILNIADALLSYHFISKERVLDEANPIWTPIIYDNPSLFLFLKISSVSSIFVQNFISNKVEIEKKLMEKSSNYLKDSTLLKNLEEHNQNQSIEIGKSNFQFKLSILDGNLLEFS